MEIENIKVKNIQKEYGNAFYILDTEQFKKNFLELEDAFNSIYDNTHIAYSYKTNYTPKLCKLVDDLGGYAEIVSDLEYSITKKLGISTDKIYFNGPYKNPVAVEEILLNGGTINIDSLYDLDVIKKIAMKYPNNNIFVGIRCNFDIDDGVISRFGFDIESNEFNNVIEEIRNIQNIELVGLHSHFATRSIDSWPQRATRIIELVDRYFNTVPKFISLGGGIFGKMSDSLKAQFDTDIPTYKDYANAVAYQFKDHFKKQKPMLIIEPGSALVGDSMKFVSKVINIKDIRGKKIATLLGSIYNINPTLNKKNPPIKIISTNNNIQKEYIDLDFGGFTCIESDYLYKGFCGNLAVGDLVVFDNVGSYSVVLKPPFILPNFPMVEVEGNQINLIKRMETFDDLFCTYKFSFEG